MTKIDHTPSLVVGVQDLTDEQIRAVWAKSMTEGPGDFLPAFRALIAADRALRDRPLAAALRNIRHAILEAAKGDDAIVSDTLWMPGDFSSETVVEHIDHALARTSTVNRATPSSPVSAPSPAGGVREALLGYVIKPGHYETATVFARGQNRLAIDMIALIDRAALSSPATPEPVSALATDGEVFGYVVTTGRGRDYFQRDLPDADGFGAGWVVTEVYALSNPAPGHGEGGL